MMSGAVSGSTGSEPVGNPNRFTRGETASREIDPFNGKAGRKAIRNAVPTNHPIIAIFSRKSTSFEGTSVLDKPIPSILVGDFRRLF